MSNQYAPDDRFVEKLEWQLSSEYRRMNHLKSAPGKIAVSRRTAAIAVMVGLALTGVTVYSAAEYLKDSWRKKIEIARVETDVNLKKTILKATQEMAAKTNNLFSLGVIEEEENLWMNLKAAKAELALKTSQVNLDEVNASGEIPRHELYAPMAGGRDFVSERLEIEKIEAARDLELIENRVKRVQHRAELGLSRTDQVDQVRAGKAAQEAKIAAIEKRLDLRKRFITGTITAEEVEIDGRIAEAERNLRAAEVKMNSLQEQKKRFLALEQIGAAESSLAQYAFKAELEAAQFELKLAAAELDILKKAK